MRSMLTLLLLLLLSAPALAVDGVAEINHTCAVHTGCFAGDGPGYPVFIDGQAGGSYRLTSNLIVPNENTDGILFNASDIGIDLNNFAIIGAGCVGSTTNCTPNSGTGSGIERTSALNRGVSVKNGSITGMGNYGVFIGDQAHITNISARWNRVDGINTSTGSIVSENTAYQNGRHGINVFASATVSGNTVYENGDDGINVFASATVSGNTVSSNVDDGIVTGGGATVTDNTVYQNGDDGIFVNSGSTVTSNTVHQNGRDGIFADSGSTVSGNTAFNNAGDGIQAVSGATVLGNTVRLNTGFGLRLDANCGYRENVISNNTAGTVNSFVAINLGNNACNGSTTCP